MTDTMSRADATTATRSTHPDTAAHHIVDEEIEALIRTAETSLPIPTRQDRFEAIIREAKCDRQTAEVVDEFWGVVVRASRNKKWGLITSAGFDGHVFDGVYHLGDDDLTGFHWVLDIIAQDGEVSPYGEGTAHDLLDRGQCDPTLGERGLVHGKSDGVVQNCTVTLELRHVG